MASAGAVLRPNIFVQFTARGRRLALRHVKLGVIEQRQLERPANGQPVLFRENQLGYPLPVVRQLAFLANDSRMCAVVDAGIVPSDR